MHDLITLFEERRAFLHAHFEEFILDAFVVMPDLVHRITLAAGDKDTTIAIYYGPDVELLHEMKPDDTDVAKAVAAIDHALGTTGGCTGAIAVVARMFDCTHVDEDDDGDDVNLLPFLAQFGTPKEDVRPDVLPRAIASMHKLMDELPEDYCNRFAFSMPTLDVSVALERLSCTHGYWVHHNNKGQPCRLLQLPTAAVWTKM